MLRGLAIIGVVFYHFCWDLSYFRFIGVDVSYEWGWVAFARALLAVFVFLVGVSLVLAHGQGVRWRPFLKRLAILVGAAGLITIGTLVAFPELFVFFGILHAIALFSVLCLPFLRAPPLLTGALGLVIVIAAFAISLPEFSAKPLAWIGFWDIAPPTNDLVPVFPWFGVALLGVATAKLVLNSPLGPRLAAFAPQARPWRWLAVLGRWTLVIYLVHQPIFLAVLFPLANQMQTQQLARGNEFLLTCERSCYESSGNAGYCTAYCACSLDAIEVGNLWDAIQTPTPTPQQSQAVAEVTNQCAIPPNGLPQ